MDANFCCLCFFSELQFDGFSFRERKWSLKNGLLCKLIPGVYIIELIPLGLLFFPFEVTHHSLENKILLLRCIRIVIYNH